VGDEHDAEPLLPLELREQVRIPTRTETSSIEVGSSATSTSGSTASARDRDALTLPARQLERTPVEEVLGGLQPHTAQELRGALTDVGGGGATMP
jgi:hypothetical protein